MSSTFSPSGLIYSPRMAVGKVSHAETPLFVTPHHLTNRLLVETVGPDMHLIFNPLSGAVDRVGDDELVWLRRLQDGETLPLTEAERLELSERAYLFENPAAEEDFLDQCVADAWARMQTGQPDIYTVCPTLACNLACAYCFEGDSLLDKAQGVMSDTQVDAFFEAIADLRRGHPAGQAAVPWLSLFGGEPLLPSTQRCVARLLAGAADGGFLVGATTNGVNVVRFEGLLREYADILAVFQITLDGPQAVHDARRHRLGGQGTFAEIVRGIDLLLDLGVDVDLRVNVDAANLSSLPELVDFLFEKGWNARPELQLALALVTDHGGGGCSSGASRALGELEMVQAILEQIERHPRMAEVCHLGFLRHLDYLVSILEPEHHRTRRGTSPAPRYWYCEASTDRQYVFTPEGLIYSCTEAVGKPSHAIGRFDPALELWLEPARQWQGRTILSHPKCRSCPISTLCGGGCNFAARERVGAEGNLLQIAVGGRDHRPPTAGGLTEPFCNAAEETVRAYLRYAGRPSGPLAPSGRVCSPMPQA